jgi:hypothetical protein
MKRNYENIDFTTSNYFKIAVKGKLDQGLSEIIGGMSISYNTINENTISYLEGEFIDQAELIGILNTLYNLRFPIVNVSMHNVNKE